MQGRPVPWWRKALFAAGWCVALGAVASPLHELGEQRLSAHMGQHLLIGDVAPLLLLLGLTGPLVRPLLALGALRWLRTVSHPFVALPLWATTLAVWHLPVLYEAAVRNEAVHLLEHASFFAAGIAVWMPVVETLPAPAWFGTGPKIVYVLTVRIVASVLGNVLLWGAGSPLYSVYARREGPSALEDQQLAGAVMLAEGMVVTAVALIWLFARIVQEAAMRQELLEEGVNPRTATRAARYRRSKRLPAESR